jgi:DNA polymerase III subunit gamma/tau
MSLAVDYRPYTFSEVVGQEVAVETMKAIAKAPGIKARSIVLKGAYGSGKSTLAKIFGKAINCTTFQKTGDVCKRGEECEWCKEAQQSNSQHFFEFDSSIIGNVDSIRNMSSLFNTFVKGRRVFNFDEAHSVSRQALTALLKVLEDGVPNSFFLFTTTEDLLETIQSRSIMIDITTLPEHLIEQRVKEVAKLDNIEISDSEVAIIAQKSNGHMRNALSILESFSMIGTAALKTPLNQLKRFVLFTLQHKDISSLLDEIMLYPIVDVTRAIEVMVKDFYLSESKFEVALRQKGLHSKLFAFFYSSLAREAMQSETGTMILLKAFNEKFSK